MVTENVFDARWMFVNELTRLGADIRTDGHHAVVRGPRALSGAPVRAHDIRAGAGLVLAGLVADGTTEVSDVHHVDRGYQDLVEQLTALGADVRRVDGRTTRSPDRAAGGPRHPGGPGGRRGTLLGSAADDGGPGPAEVVGEDQHRGRAVRVRGRGGPDPRAPQRRHTRFGDPLAGRAQDGDEQPVVARGRRSGVPGGCRPSARPEGPAADQDEQEHDERGCHRADREVQRAGEGSLARAPAQARGERRRCPGPWRAHGDSLPPRGACRPPSGAGELVRSRYRALTERRFTLR